MSAKAVKHRAVKHRATKRSGKKERDEAVVKQLVQQLGPQTKLAKLTLANWKAVKAARLVKPSAAGQSDIVRIPLDKLDDSPYQLRRDMDSDALEELTRSIGDQGLLNPILARPVDKGWEIISGHRRVGAYRRLQFAAKTDAEKEEYDAIPARELNSVTDDQVLLLGLAENMFRADISPLDAALGLTTLQKLKPALSTAAKIAEITDLPVRKVERLLHLAASPAVVQKGVSDGIKVPLGPDHKNGDGGDQGAEETRTLDLMSALQFTRLHEALSKKGANTKGGKSAADSQTGKAIERALKENWGFRDAELYVNKVIAGLSAPGPKKGRGRPMDPFKKSPHQLVVFYDRLGALTAIQRQSLRKALEELLRKLTEKPAAPTLALRTRMRKSA